MFESQWVLTPHQGREEIKEYLSEKGQTLIKNGSFPDCRIVELVGDINKIEGAELHINRKVQIGSMGLMYTSGKLCLLME